MLLQILTGSLVFIIFKLMNIRGVNRPRTLLFNYFFAFATALFSVKWDLGYTPFDVEIGYIWPAFLQGLFFVVNFLLMGYATRSVGMGLTSAFSKLSVIIPVVAGIFFLGETSRLWAKSIGLVLTIISFYLILFKKGEKALDKSAWILPVAVFLLSGAIDLNNALVTKFLLSYLNDVSIFLFWTFLVAFLLTLTMSIVDVVKNGFHFLWRNLFYGLCLGIFNFFTMKLLMMNVNIFGGSIVFPIFNSSVVLLTALLGMWFFREKLSLRQWIGVALAISAVVIIAVSI